MAEIKRADEELQLPASGVGAADSALPGMPEPVNLPPMEHGRLTRAAQNAGTALGTTVNRVRSRLTLVGPSSPRQQFSETAKDYATTASRKLQEAAHGVRESGDRLADTLKQRTSEMSEDVWQRIHALRTESQRIQREYPIQVILGCAAAAFVLGFTLRIWRSAHE